MGVLVAIMAGFVVSKLRQGSLEGDPATRDVPQGRDDDLTLIYQIERDDQQNSSVLVAAVVSVALAYVVGGVSFLSDMDSARRLGSYVLYAPFPVLALNGYITLQVAAGSLRRSYLLYLEGLSADLRTTPSPAHYPRFVALSHSLGLARTWKSLPFKLIGPVTYWSPLVTSSFFAFFVVFSVARSIHVRGIAIIAFGIFYAVLIAMNVAVLLIAMELASRNPSALLDDAKQRLSSYQRRWRQSR